MDKIKIIKKGAIIASVDFVFFYSCLIYLESLSLPPEENSLYEDLFIASMLIPTIINSVLFLFILRKIDRKSLRKIIILGIIFWSILSSVYVVFKEGWIVLPPHTIMGAILFRLPTYIPTVVLFWIFKKIRRIKGKHS